MTTPECDKMLAVKDKSQPIGEFITWLEDQGIFLAKHDDNSDRLQMYSETTEEILARFFKIDLNKVEQEKRDILDQLRANS